jgi:hypothetical protein
MNIEISFDADRVVGKLEAALARAEGLRQAMPEEFSTWQETDMNRRRAETIVTDPSTAYMVIPRRGRKLIVSRGRVVRRQRPQIIRRRVRAPPILRPELYELLRQRMSALLIKTFAAWRT